MVNYNNGKIYKIENTIDDEIYIGSTTKQYLSQRMVEHRSAFKSWKNGGYHNISVFEMFDKHGIENCFIVLLELVNCNTNDELKAREAFYIKTLVCVNKIIPLRTCKEYKIDNKEKIKVLKKQYQEENKEKIKDFNKQYQEENKEKIKVLNKQYYIENIEKYKIKHTCECGSTSCFTNKYRHEKTHKHLTYLETINK